MTEINSNSNLNMSALNEIKALLNQDIKDKRIKKIQPLRKGKFTKTFLDYNKKLLKQGRTTKYIEPNALYNLDTGRIIKNHIDKRSGKIKKSFLKKNNVFQSTFSPKKETINERFVVGNEFGDTYWDDSEFSIHNNLLLPNLIRKYNLSGNYRIIITRNQIDTPTETGKNYFDINDDFWKNNRKLFTGSSSGTMIWNESLSKGDVVNFIFTKERKLNKRFYEQKFLKGLNHCVFYPIINHFQKIIDNSKSKAIKAKNQTIINSIKKKGGLLETYKNGVPENKIPEVCDKLNIAIKIFQPFSTQPLLEHIPLKKRMTFKFINTREDHIEENSRPLLNDATFYKTDPIIIETPEEMLALKNNLKKNNEYYMFTLSTAGINSIQTIKNYYQLKSDYRDTVKEFEKETGLENCAIDGLVDPEMQKFIDKSTHFLGTVDFKNTDNLRHIGKNDAPPRNMGHIDKHKAYANFHLSSFYNGFVGKPNQLRKIDNHDRNGFYLIDNLDFSKCDSKTIKTLNKLNCYLNNNVYPKADLDLLKKLNVSFNVKMGCYGEDIDFRFNEKMIKTKDIVNICGNRKLVPYYSKYCGFICNTDKTTSFLMEGNKEYFENLHTKYDIYKFNDTYRIPVPKTQLRNKTHITSQILSYLRVMMVEQLLKMDYKKIVRVCVDGIYYEKHDFKIDEGFNRKFDFTFRNSPSSEYLSNITRDKNIQTIDFEVGEPQKYYSKELYEGQGGNGKTHKHLYDIGHRNIVYVAPSWLLANDKKIEYKKNTGKELKVLAHASLLAGSQSHIFSKKYGVYIIDEASMLSEADKKFLLKNIFGKVIFCGDIGYQLPPYAGIEMNKRGFDNIVELTKNYRYKENDKIIDIIKLVRDNINGGIDCSKLGFKHVDKEYVKNNYKKEDIILVTQNKYNDEWCEMFPHIEKYRILANSGEFNTGHITFEKPNISKNNYSFRHGFTVHSVQGSTFENNIYIDMRNFTSTRHFYTAISRARSFNQIYLIF